MLKRLAKLFASNNPAPPWFEVSAYDGTAELDLCGWLEQFFIRCQVRNKIENSICMVKTDPTFDYIQEIGKGLIPIDPTQNCRQRENKAGSGIAAMTSISLSQDQADDVELPADIEALHADWHQHKLLPYIDITLWQRIKGYRISEQPLLEALGLQAEDLAPLQASMDQVLSNQYLLALNKRVVDKGFDGLAPGSL